MVPRAGFEPAQSLDHEILSLARIPISPPRPKLPHFPIHACLFQRQKRQGTDGNSKNGKAHPGFMKRAKNKPQIIPKGYKFDLLDPLYFLPQ
jgi:hypothetical protein